MRITLSSILHQLNTAITPFNLLFSRFLQSALQIRIQQSVSRVQFRTLWLNLWSLNWFWLLPWLSVNRIVSRALIVINSGWSLRFECARLGNRLNYRRFVLKSTLGTHGNSRHEVNINYTVVWFAFFDLKVINVRIVERKCTRFKLRIQPCNFIWGNLRFIFKLIFMAFINRGWVYRVESRNDCRSIRILRGQCLAC